MKFCPKCGIELLDDAAFCIRCGTRQLTRNIDTSILQPTVKGRRRKLKIVISLLAIVLAMAIAMGVLLTKPVSYSDIAESVLFLEILDPTNEIIGTATGFVVDDGQTVVTNYHVIRDAYNIRAYDTSNRLVCDVDTIISFDEKLDLAVLRAERNTNLKPLVIGKSQSVKQGDSIVVIGYPLGLSNTISDGLISSKYINSTGVEIQQISAPISNGSSGGPVLNERGEVISVVCAYHVDGQNLNVAIPSCYINDLLVNKHEQAMTDYYDSWIHTFTVGYVTTFYNGLEDRQFYIEGFTSSHRSNKYWFDENQDIIIQYTYLYENSISVPFAVDTEYEEGNLDDLNLKNRACVLLWYESFDGYNRVMSNLTTGSKVRVLGSLVQEYIDETGEIQISVEDIHLG